MAENPFDPETINAIFKLVWSKKDQDRQRDDLNEIGNETTGQTSKRKGRITTANANALRVSCELVRIFVNEAVQRAADIAEAEGAEKVEATHLERVLPQLLLDF